MFNYLHAYAICIKRWGLFVLDAWNANMRQRYEYYFFFWFSHIEVLFIYTKFLLQCTTSLQSKASVLQRKIDIRGVYSNSNRQRLRRIYVCKTYRSIRTFLLFVQYFFIPWNEIRVQSNKMFYVRILCL